MATFESHNDYVFIILSVEERLRQTVVKPLASCIISPTAAIPKAAEARNMGYYERDT